MTPHDQLLAAFGTGQFVFDGLIVFFLATITFSQFYGRGK